MVVWSLLILPVIRRDFAILSLVDILSDKDDSLSGKTPPLYCAHHQTDIRIKTITNYELIIQPSLLRWTIVYHAGIRFSSLKSLVGTAKSVPGHKKVVIESVKFTKIVVVQKGVIFRLITLYTAISLCYSTSQGDKFHIFMTRQHLRF